MEDGWGKVMKDLNTHIKELSKAEAKDLAVSLHDYKKLWDAEYGFAENLTVCTYKIVKDLVRASGRIAKVIDHCKLLEQSTYTKRRYELKYVIGSEGVESEEINIISREASEPLSPAIFHLLTSKNILTVSLNT